MSRRRLEIGGLLALFALYMLAVPYGSFADEYENILGGRYINQGRLPHTGYFVNHLPLTYYVAAAITLVTHADVWALRALFLFGLYLWSLGIYALFSRYVSRAAGVIYLALLGLTMMIYWGHMLLAETLIAYACVTLSLLILYKYGRGHAIGTRDMVLVSILIATIALTSLGFLYVAVVMYLAVGLLFLKQCRYRIVTARAATCLLILAAPYFGLGALLLLTGGVEAFIFQNYHVNAVYHAPFNTDIQDDLLRSLTLTLKKFVNKAELATTDAFTGSGYRLLFWLLGIVSLVACWLYQRSYGRAAFLVPVMAFLSTREASSRSWVEDFHNAPSTVMSIMAASIAVVKIREVLRRNDSATPLRPLYYALAACMALVALGGLSFNLNVYFAYLGRDPVNLTSMGATPLAQVVNELTTPADHVWIGPFDNESLLYVHGRQASHQHFLVPFFALCTQCRERLLADWAATKPKIIVWRPGARMGTHKIDDFSGEILDYLRMHYFVVEGPGAGKLRHLYFLKERRASILAELAVKDYLR